ncbi:MAG: HK97 family phage prohead protease [Ferruginibacter sp.]
MISSFDFELKQLDESGTFQGLASTYNSVDHVGDQIVPGAFSRSLAGKSQLPLLMAHSTPIGTVSLSDSSAGLVAKGRLSLGIQAGRDAHQLLRDRVLTALSIGFQAVKDEVRDGVRHLIECKLFEVSLVAVGANPHAVIMQVKNVDMDEVASALASFRKEVERAIQTR